MGDSERTNVIVVGAGASKEFNLPTGAELTSIIQKDLNFEVDGFGSVIVGNGDYKLKHAIEILSREINTSLTTYANIAKQISRNMALAPSIDNYLDTHKENPQLVEIGKLAIANAIMKAEQASSLKIDENNMYN